MKVIFGKPGNGGKNGHIFNICLSWQDSQGNEMSFLRGIKGYEKPGGQIYLVYPNYNNGQKNIPFFKLYRKTEEALIKAWRELGKDNIVDFYPTEINSQSIYSGNL